MNTIISIAIFLIVIFSLVLYKLIKQSFNKNPHPPHEVKAYEQDRTALLAEIDSKKIDHQAILKSLFELAIKHAQLQPCFIFTIDADKNYYLQCAASNNEIRCEVVGNEYLETPYTLTQEQIEKLLAQGWKNEGNWYNVLEQSQYRCN